MAQTTLDLFDNLMVVEQVLHFFGLKPCKSAVSKGSCSNNCSFRTTLLNVRMDNDVKKGLEDFCASVGMNPSVAVNMFAKAVIREQRLPFEVTADPFYSKENQSRLKNAAERMNKTGGTVHELIESEND